MGKVSREQAVQYIPLAEEPIQTLYEIMYENKKPLPYRKPDGTIGHVTGKYLEWWPNPRTFFDTETGSYFYEFVPRSEWGLTYHVRRPMRNPIALFFRYYAEGRASGFPWWPVVHFSAKYMWKGFR